MEKQRWEEPEKRREDKISEAKRREEKTKRKRKTKTKRKRKRKRKRREERKIRKKKVRGKKMHVREKSRAGGPKSTLAKAGVRSHLARREMKNCARLYNYNYTTLHNNTLHYLYYNCTYN